MKTKLSIAAIAICAAIAGGGIAMLLSSTGNTNGEQQVFKSKNDDIRNEPAQRIYTPETANRTTNLSAETSQYDDAVEFRIATAVNNLIPNINLQPQDVSYLDTADLYVFMISGKIFFTTANVKSIISGDVLDIDMLKTKPERANITNEFKRIYNGGVSEENNGKSEYNISNLDTNKTINIGPDSASKKFAVMFDISCPKSKDLYPKLLEISKSNSDVQFNLMLISRTGSQTIEKRSKDIFCAADNKRSLDFYMKTSIQDQNQPQVQNCEYNPDYPAILMGEQFSGTTPVFYNSENKVLVGNKDIGKIIEYVSN